MPAPGIKHKFVSGKADSADPAKVRPSKWNEDHDTTAFEAWIASLFPQTSVYFDYVSTALCRLFPEGGGYIWIDGANRQVDSGTVLAPSGLTAGQLYNVFAYWDQTANTGAGGVRLVADTTGAGFTPHSVTGIPQMVGNAGRTLVGRVLINTGSEYFRDVSRDWVSSYWNRRVKIATANVVGGTGAATALAAVTPAVQAISWGDRPFHAECTTVINCPTGGVLFGAVLLAGTGEIGTTGYFNGAASAFGNVGGFASYTPASGELPLLYGGVRAQGQTFQWYSGQIHLTYQG